MKVMWDWFMRQFNPCLRFIRNHRNDEYYHNQKKRYPWTRLMELYHNYGHKMLLQEIPMPSLIICMLAFFLSIFHFSFNVTLMILANK